VLSLAAVITSADPGCNEYFIVLSGDVAYSGAAEVYDVVKAFSRALPERDRKAVVRLVNSRKIAICCGVRSFKV
jgi:hypothetical protein